jgi:hypothetical protein
VPILVQLLQKDEAIFPKNLVKDYVLTLEKLSQNDG